MEKLSKRALGCMYTATGLASVLCLGIVGGVNIFWLIPKGISVGTKISFAVAVIILLNAVVSPYFRYHRYRYQINDEFIDLREGYLFVERTIVPMERLHKMQTMRGPIDRMFRVAKVIVTTAGGDVTLRFLDEEKAEIIAEQLGRKINQIVIEQRGNDGE